MATILLWQLSIPKLALRERSYNFFSKAFILLVEVTGPLSNKQTKNLFLSTTQIKIASLPILLLMSTLRERIKGY